MKKLLLLFFSLIFASSVYASDTGGTGIVISSISGIQPNTTPTLDGVIFNTGQTPGYTEGLLYYDDTNGALAFYNDEADILLQIGQEMYIRVKNNTASPISNGAVCYLSGIDTGVPTADLAKADAAGTALATLGIATHEIGVGEIGYITKSGTVRDISTTGCTPGNLLFLSATAAGEFTETPPSSPNYLIQVGNCGVSDISAGTVEVSVAHGTNTGDVIKIFNGAVLEDTTVSVASDGADITLSFEKTGGGDLSLFFDGGFVPFVAAPATIILTPGSDTSPTLNYVYIPESTNVLTVSTSGFPAAQHSPVATVVCQSAASAATDGVFKVHAWTDHLSGTDDQGHLAHVNHWIREQPATWTTGVLPTTSITVNGGAIDNVYFSNASGMVLQLHDHTFPARDMGTGDQIYAVNDDTTAYRRVTDLSTLDEDSTGATLRSNNTYYSIVVFGVVSQDDADSKIYCNLPGGSYSTALGATDDINRYSNYTIPVDFRGTGFLIARVTVRYQTIDSGTITEIVTEDLRGLFPSTIPGGGTAGTGAEFPDNLFRVQAVADVTKEIAFDAAAITTGNTRTITMPDKDVDLGEIAANKAPAAETVFTGTISAASRTATFTETDDYDDCKVGSTLIADGDTRIIVALLGSDQVTVDANTTWAGATAITSLQEPIAQMKMADGTVVGYINALGGQGWIGGTGSLQKGISLGDGDSGVYENIDDQVVVRLAGAKRWLLVGGTINGQSGAISISDGPVSTTQPIYRGPASDTNSGVGFAAPDQPNIIAGGVEAIRSIEANGIIYNVLNSVQQDSVTDATTNGTTNVLKAGENFLTTCAIGDTVLFWSGTTTADYGLYSVQAVVDDENLTLNRATSGSVADMDFYVFRGGTITTGESIQATTISAGDTLIVKPTTGALTAQECRNTEISNYGQAAANTQTLPTAVQGLTGIVTIATAGAGDFHFKAGPGDKIYLDGVALDDGDKVTLSTPLVGDYFTFRSFKSGASTYDLIVHTGQGTLIDGGA